MSAESEIYAKLIATAGVTNLCGTRVYPMLASQEAELPYVIYGLVQATPHPCASGQVGFSNCVYSVECVDDAHAGAYALSEAVKDALEGYTGTAISWCSHRGDSEEWADAGDGENAGRYTIAQEWYIRTVE